MKKLLLLPVAFALFLPAAARAQDATKADDSKLTTKTATISGKVSDDGMTIVDDKSTRWTVTNPVMLNSFEGQAVTVKGHPYKGENKILVLSVSGIVTDTKQVAKKDDSALRRWRAGLLRRALDVFYEQNFVAFLTVD